MTIKAKRLLIAFVAMLSVLGLTATPALAGGSGDWYKATQCVLNNGLWAKLTNYDYGTGQQYHFSTVYTVDGYYRYAVYMDGILWSSYPHKGSIADGYITLSNRTNHTFQFQWRSSTRGYTSCYVSSF